MTNQPAIFAGIVGVMISTVGLVLAILSASHQIVHEYSSFADTLILFGSLIGLFGIILNQNAVIRDLKNKLKNMNE